MTFPLSHQRSRNTRLAPLLLLPLLFFAACSGEEADDQSPSSTTSDEGVSPPPADEVSVAPELTEGVIRWLVEAEPPSLNADDPDNLGSSTASWIQQGLLAGLFSVDENLTYVPELLASYPEPEEVSESEYEITYELKPNLQWSDGEPLTSADIVYTFEIISEGCSNDSDGTIADNSNKGCTFPFSSRAGYSAISDIDVISDTSFTVTTTSPVGDWQRLFDKVFAEHAFGSGAEEVSLALRRYALGDDRLPSSGPYTVEDWSEGERLLLTANDAYEAVQPVSLPNELEVFFLPDSSSVIESMQASAGHFSVVEAPTTAIDQSIETLQSAPLAGWQWDHIGFSLANDHLQTVAVRQAVAEALDKTRIIEEAYTPLYGPGVSPLGNSFWLNAQNQYEDNQAEFTEQDLAASAASMRSAGYTQNGQGLWEHPEDGVAEFRIMTIEGDDFRTSIQESVITQLAEAGFAATAENIQGGEFFTTSSSGEGPFASKTTWDLTIFAWAGGPWPGGQISAFGGKASANNINNIYGYSKSAFDEAAKECGEQLELSAVDECFNDIDTFVTQTREDSGVIIFPIAVRPASLIQRSDLIDVSAVGDYPTAGPLNGLASINLVE